MSNTWESVGDGVHECQNAANPKIDGTTTYTVRKIGQATKYPHVNFDYNPNTGTYTYNHVSFTGSKHTGTKQLIQTAVKLLKEKGLL